MRIACAINDLLVQTSLVFAYILLGAVIFQALEFKNEQTEKHFLLTQKEAFRRKYNITSEDLNKFLANVAEAIDHGFTKQWLDRWSLIGSIFFAGTVVTTIGYGHVTPCTTAGRIFCIFYALIGIPLTWLMLSTLSRHIINGITYLIRVLDEKLDREPTNTSCRCAVIMAAISILMILIIATFGKYLDGWSFVDGVYFGFITLSTIGFGDMVPLHPAPTKDVDQYATQVLIFTALSIVYFTIGLAIVTSFLMSIKNAMEERSPMGFQPIKDGEYEGKEGLYLKK